MHWQEVRKARTHQGDEVSQGQLDLNLHLVLWMNHGPNILVVAFEQIPNQLRLLIAVDWIKKWSKWGEFMFKHVGIMPYHKSKNIHLSLCIAKGWGSLEVNECFMQRSYMSKYILDIGLLISNE